MAQKKILWVDDEIDLLRSHIIFLTEKGYDVSTNTNGDDALVTLNEKEIDLIFLDEMMPGMGGLQLLGKIKESYPNIPVVMVTKSEAESLMDEAIGGKIKDYLTKPVNPSQVLLVCKKILEGKRISTEVATKDYLQDFNQISSLLQNQLSYSEWIELYLKLVHWDLELSTHKENNLLQTLADQKKEANKEFSKYVERNYKNWIHSPSKEDRPKLTVEIAKDFVFPLINEAKGPVFFFVLDCLRLDQWLTMEKLLVDYFKISKEYYYSILPTATPYARNALFAGLYPSDIEKNYPDLWCGNDEDEHSMNRYEKELLQLHLNRNKVKLQTDLKYLKIIDPEVGRNFEQNILSYQNSHFTAVVVNFLDMIAHGRSDSDLLKEIAPDEAAYRSLTNSWFTHSTLLSTFRSISKMKNAKIVITTDHGSIRSLRGAKVLGDRETSTNLRFKYGRNMKVDDKHAIYVRDPLEFKLPRRGVSISYIIAKEDYYFVYPTDYHKYLSHYKDTFQHGGVSLEEMILPIITLETK